MKKYPFLEAIGTADEKFLEEVFENKKHERSKIYMSKKKLFTIIAAAVLVVSLGVTAAASSLGRLGQLSNFNEDVKEWLHIPDEVPIMKNSEDYAKKIVTGATAAEDDHTPPAPGTAQITAVSATERSIFMSVEFNAEGLDIPQELPADARQALDEQYRFLWWESNLSCAGGIGGALARNGEVFSLVVGLSGIKEFPEDEIVLTLHDFGYFNTDDDFVVMRDIKAVEARLPVSEIDFIKAVKANNTAEVMETEFTAELTPYELILTADSESLAAAGYNSGWELDGEGKNMVEYMGESIVELHMLDGTVFSETPFSFGRDVSHLVTSFGGYANEEEGTRSITLNFCVPIDVSQIDYIIINDARFDFH